MMIVANAKLRSSPLLTLLCALLVAAGSSAQDKRLLGGLEAWLATWQKGQIDMTKPRITKAAMGVKLGVVDPDKVGDTTHKKELAAICDAIAAADSVAAVEVLLEVAAVGLDPAQKWTLEQRADAVRAVGELAVDRLRGAESTKSLVAIAQEVAKGKAVVRRAAALRALGRRKAEIAVAPIETALRDAEVLVRRSAAEAARECEEKALVNALGAALRTETSAAVMAAASDALRAILLRHKSEVGDDLLKHAVDSVLHTLGKGDWRSDLAAVEFVAIARSAQSVPPLIDVLVRQVPPEGKVKKEAEGLRSGTLRQRAWEALVSLSGARFPMEDPGAWQRWWEKVRNEFVVPDLDEKGAKGDETSSGSSFFGIPVRGSRVLFIVDTSGSMLEPLRAGSSLTTSIQGSANKMEAAQRELKNVVDKLTPDCAFNMVWFSNGAESWQKKMVEASVANKKKFSKAVEDLRADGATNLWDALHQGLALNSFANGSQFGETYDEVFILSDGMPTNGEVQDPREMLSILRETNRYSRVAINTVYIAGDPEMERRAAERSGMSGSEFMRKLAEENGGKSITL
ncbi:MAG: VWA domain-containing protein [Planctomycetota bacterium]